MQFKISNLKFQILAIVFAISLCSLLFASNVLAAATPTPSPTVAITPTPTVKAESTIMTQINDLKDRIASRVAQLKLVDKRAIVGTVQETTSNQITVNDIDNKTRQIDVDEITKFSSPSASGSFGISDLTKGTKISVLGLYNKQSERITARFISVETYPVFLTGVVSTLDSKEFTFVLVGEDGKQTTVSVENVTKTYTYTKDDGTTKSGFSKITPGTRVFAAGFTDKKDKTRITGTRVVLFPDLPKNPKVIVPNVQLNTDNEVVPSTGSGKKITPLR